MIRKILGIVNRKWEGMHEAAILLGIFALCSQVLGLFRDRLLAHVIGPSKVLDVYYAAFRLPDLIFLSIASLASITVLMPFLVDRLAKEGGKESAREFFNEVLTGFVLLLVVVASFAFLFMPKIAPFIAPGFSPSEIHMLVGVSRIMLLSPILLGLSNLIGTITQLTRKFFIFSLSPIFYNLGIIIGVLFFYPKFGVYGLAYGVALGAFFHLIIQVPTFLRSDFSSRLSTRLNKKTLRQVTMLSLPRTLTVSLNSIALIAIIAIGSTLGTGAISIFNFSLNLESVPVGIIGVSYSIASFPILTEAFSKGERKRFADCVLTTARQIIFWSLPLAALLIVVRAQIVRVILGSGQFSWADTRLTAAALALFALSLVAQNLILVTVRAFYAAHNTKTPLFINFLCSSGIVVGALCLLYIFKHVPTFRYFIESLLRVEDTPGTAVLMLPLAYSLGTMVNALLHYVHLRRLYVDKATDVSKTFFESLAAAFMLGSVSYVSLNALSPLLSMHTFWGVLMQGLIAGVLGIIASIALLITMKSESFFEILNALKRKFWNAKIVSADASDASVLS